MLNEGNFEFGTYIDHSIYYPSRDKLSMKWAWSGSCDLIFKFGTLL